MTLSYPKNSIFVRAVEKWGQQSQVDMMVEEAGELIVALQHSKRKSRNTTPEAREVVLGNIVEELADTEIVLRQMVYIFGVDNFEKKYAEKITRLEQKLRDGSAQEHFKASVAGAAEPEEWIKSAKSTHDKVKILYEKGMIASDIAKALKKSFATITYHLDHIDPDRLYRPVGLNGIEKTSGDGEKVEQEVIDDNGAEER